MSQPDSAAREVPDPGPRGIRAMIRRRRRSRKRDQRGLTLVELMIVVTIIAIIAAVAIAIYQDIVKKSKLAADRVSSRARSAVAIYYGRSNGLFPATMTSVEALVQPAPIYNCSVPPTYEPSNGKITFTATLSDCP